MRLCRASVSSITRTVKVRCTRKTIPPRQAQHSPSAISQISESTPWKRVASYQVPDLPACPVGGCYCAWLWIPDGCGQPNMYMQNFKCNVTNAVSTKRLGIAKPPVACRDDSRKCVAGPKQLIAWNQAEGNNVQDVGYSPGYNARMGFKPGAQNDISF
ncbi:hypothetical protein BDP67DRAFT_280793 [Colletotrichum lupini]|nr:hypothetical protein BDP67DRAFT_280793 [Colletotrichum lupini]